MFDTHCHITDLPSPLDCLRNAAQFGVTSLLCCGYSTRSNHAVLELRGRVPGLPIALGLHPWFSGESIEAVVEMVRRHQPVAIGECGLDGAVTDTAAPMMRQERVFEEQLDWASRLGLPVTVHSRMAVRRVLEMVMAFPNVRGVLHAYGGAYEQLHGALGRGWMIGVGGAVTRAGAHKLHRLVRRLPMDCLLLETDSPSIGLETIAAEDVRPSHVALIAECLSKLRATSAEHILIQTDGNAMRLFGEAASSDWIRGIL